MSHTVIIPALPNTDDPSEEEQVEAALKAANYDENTVLFGHSLGAAVALKVVEKLDKPIARSEEHTSELQSLTHLVCRLLLEKKNDERLVVDRGHHRRVIGQYVCVVRRARRRLPQDRILARVHSRPSAFADVVGRLSKLDYLT